MSAFTQQISKSKGVTTGVGICHYFCILFEANELAPKKRRITDKQIAGRVSKEFPKRDSAQHFSSGQKTVNDYRQRYNKGIFTRGVPPEKMSFRYDSKGFAVDSRTGRHRLLPEEVQIARSRYSKFRRQILETKFKED